MNKERIKQIIKLAKECANEEDEYKNETFSSILTAMILSENRHENLPSIKRIQQSKHLDHKNKPLSLREFFLKSSTTSDVEKTALFAYYIENNLSKENFTVEDIVNAFREAKEPVPKNPSDKIYKCIMKAWITKGKEKNTYTLTNPGIDAVESNFGKANMT